MGKTVSVDLRHQSSHESTSSTKDLVEANSNASLPEIHVTVQSAADFEMSYIRRYVTVGVLFLVNLLNYMDRSTIAGKVSQQYYVCVIVFRNFSASSANLFTLPL